MCDRYLQTSRSKIFIKTEVSAMGLQSLRQVMLLSLGIGIIMANLKHAGTVAVLRDQLVRMGVSLFAQFFSVAGVTPFGPAAATLLVF